MTATTFIRILVVYSYVDCMYVLSHEENFGSAIRLGLLCAACCAYLFYAEAIG